MTFEPIASRRWLVAAVVAVAACASVAAQQRSPMQERGPKEYADLLESPERVARLQVARVVETLKVTPGMKVADVGAGSGLFTRAIAKAAAPAIVYGVDIDGPLLAILAQRAKDAGLTNVRAVVAGPTDPKIPEQVDLILVCDALHHVEQPAAFLKTLRGYLLPGGRLAIIDYRTNWPEGHEKMAFTLESLDEWMRDAGFAPVASFDWIADGFFTIYR